MSAKDLALSVEVIAQYLSSYDFYAYCDIDDDFKELKRDVSELQAENRKLRELVKGMWYCAHEAYGMCARVPVGGERPFTCCPLYDFDAREYRCEKLMRELRIEVGE